MFPGDRVHGETGALCLAFAQQPAGNGRVCPKTAKSWLILTSKAGIKDSE
jgi:hypothetical protein